MNGRPFLIGSPASSARGVVRSWDLGGVDRPATEGCRSMVHFGSDDATEQVLWGVERAFVSSSADPTLREMELKVGPLGLYYLPRGR